MKVFLTNIYCRLASLTLGLWLLGGVMLILAAGSFLQGEGSSINEVALLEWLREVPFRDSWWLWIAIALLAVLALNTLLCSIDSLRTKWQKGSFLVRIAPQLMHLGFLFIMLAHLQSAYGGFKQSMQVEGGSAITFPDGSNVVFTDFAATYSRMGMPTAYSATLNCRSEGQIITAIISPNHPFFHQGHGIYIKDIAPPPMKAALVEVHKEPGAGMALAGGALFTVANLILLARRREKTL
ncbi:MAG TPA: cytochrome c biogenesis protein ResB [Geobacteraceae bacterium]|nr:cytochrome c biogenesis protein ResB [Geobacteraceae bacterium]